MLGLHMRQAGCGRALNATVGNGEQRSEGEKGSSDSDGFCSASGALKSVGLARALESRESRGDAGARLMFDNGGAKRGARGGLGKIKTLWIGR